MNRRSCRSTKRSTGSDSRRRLSPHQSWKPPEAAIESDPYEAVYPLFVVAQKIKDNAGSGRLKHDGAAAALSARGFELAFAVGSTLQPFRLGSYRTPSLRYGIRYLHASMPSSFATWNGFPFFALNPLTTKEQTMTDQSECPTIEEMISDEVRKQFGARTFQTYEKRAETEKGRGYLRFLKLPTRLRLATYPHAAR